jgi:hypothetical protein
MVWTPPFRQEATVIERSDPDALLKANALSDLPAASKPAARANLGLKGGAVLDVGTGPGTLAAGDDSRILGAAQNGAAAITGGTINGVSIGATTRATQVNAQRFSLHPTGTTQTTYDFGAGGIDDVTRTPLYLRCRWTGVVTGSDTATQTTSAPVKVVFTDQAEVADVQAVAIAYSASGQAGSYSTGQRSALHCKLAVQGQYSGTAAADPYLSFVGTQNTVSASVSQGGTGVWPNPDPGQYPNNPVFRAAVQGGNNLVLLKAGATAYQALIGFETAMAAQAGSSVWQKIGIHVGKKDDDVVPAIGDEHAIEVSSGAGVSTPVGWKRGIAFGRTSGADNWPIAADGTLIGICPEAYPTAKARSARTAAHGVDLREATFSGLAFASPGFAVDGRGAIASGPGRMRRLVGGSTDATPVRLTADGLAAGAENTLNLPDHSAVAVRLRVVARQTGGAAGAVGDSAMWEVTAFLTRGAGAASTVHLGNHNAGGNGTASWSITTTAGANISPLLASSAGAYATSGGATAWRIQLSADTANGGLAVVAVGEASKTIAWAASVLSAEAV